ncbi:MAG TPA: ABC transporter ATP-binding protein [Anaerolineales bacterium]|nr:ABC transporter ATP-binding protein [Anaerolineales bacterium]
MSLELKGIMKRFPGVLACDNVELHVETGEILALLGENGAGKTTLMNILYGLYTPDQGEVFVDGKPLQLSSPADSIAAGIGMVHQHFMLVPVFTVTENVILGMEPANSLGWLNKKAGSQIVKDISGRYNLEVDPEALIEDLPVGVQQRVEIIKVLSREARYLVFDEPTSVLTPQEVEEFFRIVKGLREDGKGIIFISHKLNEALEIADRIVVIRDGKIVDEVSPEQVTKEQLAELMVGRPIELVVQKEIAEAKDKVLVVNDLVALDDRDHRAVDGVSFEVRAGEIVGIAGVQGNGQTELIDSIMGIRMPLAGSVFIGGQEVTHVSPRDLHRIGVAHVPEDRQESGLIVDFTVTENMILDNYYVRPYSRGIQMDWRKAEESAERLVKEYDVRTPGTEVQVSTLSGGNQQKVIVAREFDRDVKLIVASQPTRGIDVGSIEYIHNRIVEERDKGVAVLIVSSELDEVMALSDRILVMYRGKIVGEFDPVKDSTTEIGLAMLGGSK